MIVGINAPSLKVRNMSGKNIALKFKIFATVICGTLSAVNIVGSEDKTNDAPWQADADTPLLLHFDEGEKQTAGDASSNGNDGRLSTIYWKNDREHLPPVWTSEGRFGPAVKFDGEDDYIVCGRSPSLDVTTGPMTLEAWVKPYSVRNEQYIADKSLSAKDDYRGYCLKMLDNGVVQFRLGAGKTFHELTSAEKLPANQWTHVAGTWDGREIKLYLNGRQERRSASFAGPIAPATNADFQVSRYWNTFNGVIDEVRLSKTVRYTSDFTVILPLPRPAADKRISKYYPCVKAVAPPVIDGNLVEWTNAVPWPLKNRHAIEDFSFKGSEDLDATLYLMWDEENLYLATDVRDDVFYQPFSEANTWKGDNIQLAFDPLHDAVEPGWGADDYEYSLSLTKNGPEAWRARGLQPAGSASLKLAIGQTAGRTIYETAIPWENLAPFQPGLNKLIGFDLIVNDNDGRGGKGWIEWTPGIAGGRNPSLFGSVCLVKAAPRITGDFHVPERKSWYDDNAKVDFVYEITSSVDAGKCKAVFQVRQNETLAGSTTNEVGIKSGRNRIPFEFATRRLPDGKYNVEAFLFASNGVLFSRGAVGITKRSSAAIKLRFEQARSKAKTLNELIREAADKGVDTTYPTVTKTLLEDFDRWVELDLKAGKMNKVDFMLKYLDESADRAIAEVMGLIKNPSNQIKAPNYEMTHLNIKNGFFYKENNPTFLTGVLPSSYNCSPLDFAMMKGYGFNLITIHEDGPLAVFPEINKEKKPACRGMDVAKVFNQARANNLAVQLELPTAYFPKWAYDKDPDLKDCGAWAGFPAPCPENPLAREIWAKWYQKLLPMVKDDPILLDYIISDEFHYPNIKEYCKYCGQKYGEWLKNKYKKVENLNKAWASNYSEFKDIPPIVDPKQKAGWYDWNNFAEQRAIEFFSWMRDTIRAIDGHTPIQTMLVGMPDAAFGDHVWSSKGTGLDWEGIAELCELNGVDTADNWRPTGIYGYNWQKGPILYDLMKSLAPDKPICDSWHVADQTIRQQAEPPDLEYIPPEYTRAICWLTRLHGQAAAGMWIYCHEYGRGWAKYIQQYALLDHPELLEALGRTFLDLQRLAGDIIPFSSASGPMAILYSPPSRCHKPYTEETYKAYEGACFLDLPVRFISESQIMKGRLKDYKVLVIPRAMNVKDNAYEEIKKFIGEGNTAVIIGDDALKNNEYGWPRNTGILSGLQGEISGFGKEVDLYKFGRGKIYYFAVSQTPEKYCRIFDALLDKLNIAREARLAGKDGQRVFGVECRTVRSGSRRLAYIINLTRNRAEVELKINGKARSMKNLITGQMIEPTMNLESLEVVLLEMKGWRAWLLDCQDRLFKSVRNKTE